MLHIQQQASFLCHSKHLPFSKQLLLVAGHIHINYSSTSFRGRGDTGIIYSKTHQLFTAVTSKLEAFLL